VLFPKRHSVSVFPPNTPSSNLRGREGQEEDALARRGLAEVGGKQRG